MEPQPSSSQCVHVAFADHYVTITSNLAYDALSLAASMAPMLVSEPSGTCAGCLQAFASGNRFAIKGTDRLDCEYFEDAEEGVRALHHRVVKLLLDARPDLLLSLIHI